MSKARKTISVVELTEIVNQRNRFSTCEAEMRAGWNLLLEEILQQTGNHEGFRHLTQSEVPDGCEPGIVREGDTPKFPDETRICFLLPPSLLTQAQS